MKAKEKNGRRIFIDHYIDVLRSMAVVLEKEEKV